MIKLLRTCSTNAGILFICCALTLCSDDDNTHPLALNTGFFIVNEGGFNHGNTSLSFYDRRRDEVMNNVFFHANDVPLGDQAQSMTIHNGKGYIVVQNANPPKIEVVNIENFTIIATIHADLHSPRYFVGYSPTKGYVSDWGADGISGTIKVINLENYEITKTIATGQGTNRMLLVGSKLYATNSGASGRDNTITVLDTSTDEIINTIKVADNPNSLVLDKNQNLWIASSGHTAYDPNTFIVIPEESTPASITRINLEGTERLQLNYTEVGFSQNANNININAQGDQIYYLYNGFIYTLGIEELTLPTAKFTEKAYYGLAVDPIDNNIIGCEAPDFTSPGNIDIYTTAGNLSKTFSVGIGPNGVTFK